MTLRSSTKAVVHVAGAGPAGLAAAITLAGAGRSVIVHEAHDRVGYRFGQDLQGLENWTVDEDVLDELRRLGLTTRFDHRPCRTGWAFDAWGRRYRCCSQAPLFYMVERGPNPGSLDYALYAQARERGVVFRFNHRVQTLPGTAIWATGPHVADAIAGGYHFETDMAEGFWVICDNRLAPGGYAYLLVMVGKGTVKSCLFRDFERCREYADATVQAFVERVGLRMTNPRWHAGAGNFCLPLRAMRGRQPMVGEHAGFQDTLWGFGLRHAIRSGVLAARALLEGSDYEQAWRHSFGRQMQASVVNRLLYGWLGNYGYRRLLQRQAQSTDARMFLRDYYRYTRWKGWLWPLARRLVRSGRKDLQCGLAFGE